MEARKPAPERSDDHGKQVPRRSFLNYLIGVSLTTFGLFSTYAITKYLFPLKSLRAETESGLVRFSLAEIPVGEAKILRYKGEPSIVVRTHERTVRALSAVCTHLGCIVKWDSTKQLLVCPCHAAFFDVNGNVAGGPAPSPLASYPAQIVQNEVIIGDA